MASDRVETSLETREKTYGRSVMTYITVSLALILALVFMSIFVAYWVTEQAEHDAQAINVAGSIRMGTYRAGMAVAAGDNAGVQRAIAQLDQAWNHSVFAPVRDPANDSELARSFQRLNTYWEANLKPWLERATADPSVSIPAAQFDAHVGAVDAMVGLFQGTAENRIASLRVIQVLTMFVSVVIGSLIFYWLRNRVERPLAVLTDAARQIGRGDFSQRVDVVSDDELGLLSKTLNQTTQSLAEMYHGLEARVQEKTQELQRHNTSISFLFRVARQILEQKDVNYQAIVEEFADILNEDNVELCLFTLVGNRPYLQVTPCHQSACAGTDCGVCRSEGEQELLNMPAPTYKFPVVFNGEQHGVLGVQTLPGKRLEPWQEQLTQSVADQFAISLSLKEQKDKDRGLALMQERNVIARELHDSLAQSLSYLQIQVSRLQKTADNGNYERQQEIIDELREGLSAAYQSLRELLTTFRLRLAEEGLHGSLQKAAQQMQERSNIEINLHYQLANIPLSTTEEIHLLQIALEAMQNAVKHSEGTRVDVRVVQQPDRRIQLQVEDDGVGLSDTPEKLNHYGLAIMQERSKQLRGSLKIGQGREGGTRVAFDFMPTVIYSQSA